MRIDPWHYSLYSSFLRTKQVRAVLLRGLLSFPAEPGMLCMLLDAEQFSNSQQRLIHHLAEVRHMHVGFGVGNRSSNRS